MEFGPGILILLILRLTSLLDRLAQGDLICPNITNSSKMPFIAFYPYITEFAANEGESNESGAENKESN